jgi:hypothetical protein
MALHEATGNTWRWDVWQVVAGKGLGDYINRSANHTWASLDGDVKIPNDQQHVVSEVLPHVSESSSMITEWVPELSRWPTGRTWATYPENSRQRRPSRRRSTCGPS